MRRILLSILFLLVALPAQAATYYMSTTGGNAGHTGASDDPWLTLQYAISQMSGGDILIVNDGTYTGSANTITTDYQPPNGSSGAYTTIRAANDGGAIFDGQGARNPIEVYGSDENKYWSFEGLLFCRGSGSVVGLLNCRRVKFLRCGAYDGGTGNNMVWDNTHCQYLLYENCYAYGTGRYKFTSYESSYVVYRQCVGRFDSVNAGGEPIAVFSMYSCNYVEVQNCIAIDSDQTSTWSNVGQYGSCYLNPSTDADENYVYYRSCIALNSALGGFNTTGNEYHRAADILYDNCVEWDCYAVNNESPNVMRGLRVILQNCTFGVASGLTEEYIWSYDSGGNGSTTSKNNIFYGITGSSVNYDVETQDYNSYYSNTNNANSGAHDITAVNPLSASLLYLPRIETGSALDGAGESGADVGANAMLLIGTPGTYYGETGYATPTATSMWPFPYEDLIESKMGAYTHTSPTINGARGFCAAGNGLYGGSITLTSYIWEYLGNEMPGDIYAGSPLTITTTSLPNGTVGVAYSQSVSATGGTSPYSFNVTSGSLPTSLNMSSAGAITGTPTVADTFNFTVTVTDDVEDTDDQNLSITMASAGSPGNTKSKLSGKSAIMGKGRL